MSEGNKRKKSFYSGKYGSKKGKYNMDIRPKLKGFILTCNGQDRNAVLEGYRILNEYADKRYGPENPIDAEESDSDGVEDIEAALKEEITAIKTTAKSTDRRFQTVQNKANNVIFIKTTLDDPTQIVKDIFDDLFANPIPKTKHCCKLMPVSDTCYAKVNQIVDMAKPLIQKLFSDSKEKFSYCIMWKTRCNNSIKRDDVYPDLVKVINEEVKDGHVVDYDKPDVVINIDIIGNICCMGFLRDYHKFGKYNIDTVCNKGSLDSKSKREEVADGAELKVEEEKPVSDEILAPVDPSHIKKSEIVETNDSACETKLVEIKEE